MVHTMLTLLPISSHTISRLRGPFAPSGFCESLWDMVSGPPRREGHSSWKGQMPVSSIFAQPCQSQSDSTCWSYSKIGFTQHPDHPLWHVPQQPAQGKSLILWLQWGCVIEEQAMKSWRARDPHLFHGSQGSAGKIFSILWPDSVGRSSAG